LEIKLMEENILMDKYKRGITRKEGFFLKRNKP
jgi:hypothetical protein